MIQGRHGDHHAGLLREGLLREGLRVVLREALRVVLHAVLHEARLGHRSSHEVHRALPALQDPSSPEGACVWGDRLPSSSGLPSYQEEACSGEGVLLDPALPVGRCSGSRRAYMGKRMLHERTERMDESGARTKFVTGFS